MPGAVTFPAVEALDNGAPGELELAVMSWPPAKGGVAGVAWTMMILRRMEVVVRRIVRVVCILATGVISGRAERLIGFWAGELSAS